MLVSKILSLSQVTTSALSKIILTDRHWIWKENLRMGGDEKRPLLEQIERISEMANFVYVRQKGPYGNGTPLLNVQQIVGDEPFIYTFSDDFIVAKPVSRFRQMIDIYK